MAKVQELIDTILSDTKYAEQNRQSRVYQDEAILRPASSLLAKKAPYRYREMRSLIHGHDMFQKPRSFLFYKQAKFMEFFEDSYEYHGEFDSYYPTYQSMNDYQLRGYFSWRTKVRQGIIEETNLSFAFVYLYELLHQIGSSSPEESLEKLLAFEKAYRVYTPQITRYINGWVKDYIIYHQMDPTLLKTIGTNTVEENIVLLSPMSSTEQEVFSSLVSLSGYAIEKSSFYQKNKQAIQTVTYRVLQEIMTSYKEKVHTGLSEDCFLGSYYTGACTMFHTAVFYDYLPKRTFDYQADDLNLYHCNKGVWSCERFYFYRGKKQPAGALLRNIESEFRYVSGYKPLKSAELFAEIQKIITREIGIYQKEAIEAARPKITIDLSQLAKIRETALVTQSKLVVEETEESEKEPETITQPEEQHYPLSLNENEYRLLHCLLYEKPYASYLKEHGLLLSVLTESINEKLFDTFADMVITYENDQPEIVKDYETELKGIIQL